MGFLAFLNPIFLAGLLAAAIPVVIHLLLKKYAKRVRFPSFKFLTRSDRVTSQNKIKEIILLAMRALLMALLALAFARPYFIKSISLQGENLAAVIIIDNSYSMLYNGNLEKAKDKAVNILDKEIKAGNMCAVLTLTSTLAGMDVYQESGMLKNKIQQLTADTTLTNFKASVRKASQLLSGTNAGKRKLFIISDLQKLGWEDFNFSEKLPAGIEVSLSNLGNEEAENMAITNAVLPPVLLDDGEPVKLVARVENFSDKQKTTNIKFFIENREVKKEAITVPARGYLDVEFIALFGETLGTRGYFQIDDDKLLLDNKYYYSFRKRAALNVLLINGSASSERNEDAAYFLSEAINPGGDASSLIKVKTILPQNTEQEDFSKLDVVIISNVKALSSPAVSKIKTYLENWGKVIIGLGDNVEATVYNNIFGRDILPAELSAPKGDALDRSRYLSLLSVNYANNLFMLFKNPRYQKSLESPRFFKYFQTFSTRNPILARFGNGEPAIVEKNYKDGKVLLFTSSFDRKWSDLPARAVFLPLVHEMLYYLTMSSEPVSDYRVNLPLIWHGRWKEMEVTPPSGESKYLKFYEGSAAYNDTFMSGFYKSRIEKNNDYFAVNLNTKESDLVMDSEKDILTNLTMVPGIKANSEESKKMLDVIMQQQQEKINKLWWWLLCFMFILSFVELTFGNRIYV